MLDECTEGGREETIPNKVSEAGALGTLMAKEIVLKKHLLIYGKCRQEKKKR